MTREQFSSYVESTQKEFRRFLTALCCGDSSLADDIAQESYIKAYLSCHSLSELRKFKSWLVRIGYNTFINYQRSKRDTMSIENARELTASVCADTSFAYQDLYEALSKIPTKERTSILLFYIQGFSVKEIAEILESSAEAVKQNLYRGRVKLRSLLFPV